MAQPGSGISLLVMFPLLSGCLEKPGKLDLEKGTLHL